jgi:hypothetical protein
LSLPFLDRVTLWFAPHGRAFSEER